MSERVKRWTPGPWRVGQSGPNGCPPVGTERGLMVAMAAHSLNDPRHHEAAKANANLIAASPALVEALEGLMETESRGRIMPIGPEWDAAREALALAYGETH